MKDISKRIEPVATVSQISSKNIYITIDIFGFNYHLSIVNESETYFCPFIEDVDKLINAMYIFPDSRLNSNQCKLKKMKQK